MSGIVIGLLFSFYVIDLFYILFVSFVKLVFNG